MAYFLQLSADNGAGVLNFPELPEELQVSGANDAETETNVLGYDRTVRHVVPLREYFFTAHFTRESGQADSAIVTLEAWRSAGAVLRLIYATDRGGGHINTLVSLTDCNYIEVGGDVGSIEVDVTLQDYRPPVIKELQIVQQKSGEAIAVAANQREDTQPKPATYTMVAGDNLYNIAKAVYGDSKRWPDIAAANNIKPEEYRKLQIGRVLVLP